MAKKKGKPIVFPVVFMVLVAAVFTGVLATLNAVTIDTIREQEELKKQTSILYVFDQTIPADADALVAKYNEVISHGSSGDVDYYMATVEGQVTGYAFEFQGSGLWGTIWGYVAVTPEFDQIMGVDFIKHSETPGLGGRISEAWYRDQFRGISLDDAQQEFIIYKPAAGGNVDAVTGATLTSVSVKNMLDERLRELLANTKGAI